MKDLKGTKTEANLWVAFAGESQARNRYNISSGVAKKGGLYVVSSVFSSMISSIDYNFRKDFSIHNSK